MTFVPGRVHMLGGLMLAFVRGRFRKVSVAAHAQVHESFNRLCGPEELLVTAG